MCKGKRPIFGYSNFGVKMFLLLAIFTVSLLQPTVLGVNATVIAAELDAVKNIIYIIGDGTSFVQLDVGRIMKEGPLVVDSMGVMHQALNASLNNAVTDSAASGTAHATGERTNNGMVSMRPDGSHIPTIVEMAKRAGLATGVVTNDAIYGATPASYLAHAKHRSEYEIIVEQAIFQTAPDVLLGGGKRVFDDIGGPRRLNQTDYNLVETREQLLSWNTQRDGKLLGLFAPRVMAYAVERPSYQPTLAEMAQVALDVLSKHDDGFFLMIENDLLDVSSHNNNLRNLAYETGSFDDAIATALAFAEGRTDTLVVVTADHETGGLTKGEGQASKTSLMRSFDRPSPADVQAQVLRLLSDDPHANILTIIRDDLGIEGIEPFLYKGNFDSFMHRLVTYDTFYYTTTGHTNAPVPVYAHGASAELFYDVVHIKDMGQLVIRLLKL